MSQDRSFRRTHLGDHRLHPATQMVSFGYAPSMSEGAVKPPVFLTSTFAFESAQQGADFFDVAAGRKPAPRDGGAGGLVYSRFNHPNTEIVEDRLALVDGAQGALLTASGMAAIAAVLLTLMRPGDSLVHYSPLYGGTEGLIARALRGWGVRATPFLDGTSPTALAAALDRAQACGPVRVVYLETPANPTNAMIDLAMARQVVDDWAARVSARPPSDGRSGPARPVLVCDNTLLGPVFQQPLALGIDLCVYSLTKYVGGHSDLIAGAVTGPRELVDAVRQTRGTFGFQLDPHSSWMLSRSMETLSLRMHEAARSGTVVAAWLASNGNLPCRVLHPEHLPDRASRALYERQCSGPGSTFSFVVDGDRALAFRILDRLRLFKLAVSLGGTESLACHPASTTHSGIDAATRARLGIDEGLIRLSVGLEHPADLVEDLRQAFIGAIG
ncbi:MAG: cystathionine gamma-synthase family protein [Lautropia sp.]